MGGGQAAESARSTRCPGRAPRSVGPDRLAPRPRTGRGAGPHVTGLVGELVYEDAVPEGGLADLGAGAAVHREPVAVLAHDLHGALRRAGLLGSAAAAETGGVRGADGDAGAQPGAGEVGGLLVGDEAALLQGDDPVGGAGGLLGVGRW